MKKKSQALETVVHGVFLLLGLITVGCVLLISVYLIVSGIPAIRQIGLIPFLFGKTWASTAAEPSTHPAEMTMTMTTIYGLTTLTPKTMKAVILNCWTIMRKTSCFQLRTRKKS